MPQSGKMRFNGHSLADQSVKERADQIGYILQDPNQMISKTMILMKLLPVWSSEVSLTMK